MKLNNSNIKLLKNRNKIYLWDHRPTYLPVDQSQISDTELLNNKFYFDLRWLMLWDIIGIIWMIVIITRVLRFFFNFYSKLYFILDIRDQFYCKILYVFVILSIKEYDNWPNQPHARSNYTVYRIVDANIAVPANWIY